MRTSPERRRVRMLVALVAAEALVVAGLALGGAVASRARGAVTDDNRALVAALRLTDLALWSDASYCRHPALADRFAAHALHPAAFEPLPAGSFGRPRDLGRVELEAAVTETAPP